MSNSPEEVPRVEILALWDNPRRTPIPRIVFLHDTKARSSTLTADQIGEDYLKSPKPGEGFKVERPKKVLIAGNSIWRMDYWRPDTSGQSFHSSFAVPLKDRRVLFIDMNSSSRSQFDVLCLIFGTTVSGSPSLPR